MVNHYFRGFLDDLHFSIIALNLLSRILGTCLLLSQWHTRLQRTAGTCSQGEEWDSEGLRPPESHSPWVPLPTLTAGTCSQGEEWDSEGLRSPEVSEPWNSFWRCSFKVKVFHCVALNIETRMRFVLWSWGRVHQRWIVPQVWALI